MKHQRCDGLRFDVVGSEGHAVIRLHGYDDPVAGFLPFSADDIEPLRGVSFDLEPGVEGALCIGDSELPPHLVTRRKEAGRLTIGVAWQCGRHDFDLARMLRDWKPADVEAAWAPRPTDGAGGVPAVPLRVGLREGEAW